MKCIKNYHYILNTWHFTSFIIRNFHLNKFISLGGGLSSHVAVKGSLGYNTKDIVILLLSNLCDLEHLFDINSAPSYLKVNVQFGDFECTTFPNSL